MTQDEMMVLQQGRVPALPIVRALRQYVLETGDEPKTDKSGKEVVDLTPLSFVSERSGVPLFTLVTWFERPERTGPIPFDIADKLLCACSMYTLWYGELREYYYNCDLTWKQCEAPDCAIWFREGRVKQGPTVKRYCSKNCADANTRIQRGEQTRRVKNYGSRLAPRKPIKGVEKCRNGHERTPDNTIRHANGKIRCRVCNNAASKAGYHRRRAAVA